MNEQEMNFVQEALQRATSYGLQTEVVYSALQAMKEHPDISVTESLQAGCNEWDV